MGVFLIKGRSKDGLLMDEGYKDIWEWIGFNKQEKPDDIIRKVTLNVWSLVEEHLLKEEPTTLIEVGRKSAHLCTHYRSRIQEKGFLSCRWRLFKTSEFFETKPPLQIPTDKPVILIADTIHRGEELSNVLTNLHSIDIKVKKIFCYLKNEEGVQNLVNEDLIDREDVVGLFSSHSEEEYMKEYNRLQVLFRSRIEPMDPDLCFDLYNVDEVLHPRKFKKISEPVLRDLFEQRIEVAEFSDRGLASNIKELHCNVESCPKIEEIGKGLFQEGFDYEANCVSIRSKINQKKIDSDFTIIAKTEANCNLKKTDAGKCLKVPENCCITRVGYKKGKKPDVKKMICPACVDLQISDSILNRLESSLINGFREKGLECKKQYFYRPYQK